VRLRGCIAFRRRVNRSRTHVDVMIGTHGLNATVVTQSGRRVSLVTDGSWVILSYS
jgi:Thermophilic metalloprotease (M29)